MLDGMTNIKASEVLKEIKYYTEDLPPYSPDEVAEALEMAIKALEQQPCEDCISREAAIKNIKWWFREAVIKNIKWYFDKIELNPDILIDSMITLPSVIPERPKGKWIWDLRMGLHKCSVCSKFCDFDYLYCPNCGAEMKGKENED